MNAAIALLLALQAAPASPAPAPKHRIEGKLSIEEEKDKGRWLFVVAGTTDLPDGAILRGELAIVDEFDDYKGGKVEGEEMMVDRRNKWLPKAVVAGGAFRATYFQSLRAPFAFRYRAKIRYEAGSQPPDLAEAVGDPDFEVRAELDRRAPGRLDREFHDAAMTIVSDLDGLLKRFSELQQAFVANRRELDQKKFDPRAWEEWKKGWRARLQEVEDRNNRRWEFKNVWQEREGRARIEMLIGMLTAVCGQLCDPFFAGQAEMLPQAQQAFDAFVQDYAAAIDGLGIDAPFDLAQIGDQLTVYAATLQELSAIAAAKDAEKWSLRGDALRLQARKALLHLSEPKIVPRRGYELLAEVAGLCNDLFAAAEACCRGKGDPAAFAALLQKHDARVRDLRALAEQGK